MIRIANIVLNDFTSDSRVLKTSKSLTKLGYKPIVVAIHGDGLKQKELVDGVCVERIKLTSRPWGKFKLVQIIKYLEFLFRAFWRFRNVDVTHCNDLNALPVGLLIKLFKRKVKVIYDCHEYETEVNGLNGVERKLSLGWKGF